MKICSRTLFKAMVIREENTFGSNPLFKTSVLSCPRFIMLPFHHLGTHMPARMMLPANRVCGAIDRMPSRPIAPMHMTGVLEQERPNARNDEHVTGDP